MSESYQVLLIPLTSNFPLLGLFNPLTNVELYLATALLNPKLNSLLTLSQE